MQQCNTGPCRQAPTANPSLPTPGWAHLSCRGDACPQLHHRQHVCLLRPQAGQPFAPVLFLLVIAEAQQQRPGAQPRHLQQAGGMAAQAGEGQAAWLMQTIKHAGSCRCQNSCSRAVLVQTDAARAGSNCKSSRYTVHSRAQPHAPPTGKKRLTRGCRQQPWCCMRTTCHIRQRRNCTP
jgi:hypothetical protein